MNPNRRKAYIAMVINVVIWGASLPLVKAALSYITPFQFLFLRYLIAAPIMLIPLIIIWKRVNPSLKTIAKIATLEFLGVPLALSFLYFGLARTTSIEASLLSATTPIFITIGGVWLLKEKENIREWQGLAIAFMGTLLLAFGPIILNGGSLKGLSLTGNLLILAHNFLWTAYLLLAKKNYQKISKVLVTSISTIVALISFFIFTLLTQPIALPTLTIPSVAIAAIYMGVLGTPIAYTLYLYGQSKIEASEASLFNYLGGPIAIPFAILILGETLTWPAAGASILIALGVYKAEYRSKKTPKN